MRVWLVNGLPRVFFQPSAGRNEWTSISHAAVTATQPGDDAPTPGDRSSRYPHLRTRRPCGQFRPVTRRDRRVAPRHTLRPMAGKKMWRHSRHLMIRARHHRQEIGPASPPRGTQQIRSHSNVPVHLIPLKRGRTPETSVVRDLVRTHIRQWRPGVAIFERTHLGDQYADRPHGVGRSGRGRPGQHRREPESRGLQTGCPSDRR
jgi:hypothetical protein